MAKEHVDLPLRDGSHVHVRAVLPTDRDELAAAFERLSPRSRRRRFLVPSDHLRSGELDYFTRLDHHDHEALAAFDPTTGRGVGVARFVRLADRPDTAETAVTVADEWQQRGLGTALLTLLAERARQEGIRRFTGLLLAENHEMLEVMRALLPTRVLDRGAGTIQVEAELEPGARLRSFGGAGADSPP